VPAARGIGVDVETALAVEADPVSGHFMGRRMTNVSTTTTSAVHFLTRWPPQTCLAGTPLTVHTVEDQVLADSTSVFDFAVVAARAQWPVHLHGGRVGRRADPGGDPVLMRRGPRQCGHVLRPFQAPVRHHPAPVLAGLGGRWRSCC
jgi:hypothetical protein